MRENCLILSVAAADYFSPGDQKNLKGVGGPKLSKSNLFYGYLAAHCSRDTTGISVSASFFKVYLEICNGGSKTR
jgi:hypothetical protein